MKLIDYPWAQVEDVVDSQVSGEIMDVVYDHIKEPVGDVTIDSIKVLIMNQFEVR